MSLTPQQVHDIAAQYDVDYTLLQAYADYIDPRNKVPHVSSECERARIEIPAFVRMIIVRALVPSPIEDKWQELEERLHRGQDRLA